MITSVCGNNLIGFSRPGGSEDIFAFPLEEVMKGDNVYYKRAGGTADNTWERLKNILVGELTDRKQERLEKLKRIFESFTGKAFDNLTPCEAIAVCAIGCDFMKGSGNKIFVQEVIDSLKDNPTFTAVTRMADAGVNVNVVAELLGHGDIRTTHRHSHALEKAKREAVEKLAKSGAAPQNGLKNEEGRPGTAAPQLEKRSKA